MALLAVLALPVALGAEAITFRNPDAATDTFTNANNTVRTETVINVTTSGNVNVSNCSAYFYATDTNETQASPVLISTNSTGNQTNTTTVNATEWNFNVSGNQFEDTTNGVFNVSCESYNVSANTPFSQTQSVRIDHGAVPTLPTGVTPTSKASLEKSDRTMSFSGTVNARNTTGCYVQFSGATPNGKSIFATNFLGATATNCTIQISSFPEGTYRYVYFATDGINDTAAFSGTREFTVNYFTGGSKVGYVMAGQQQATQQATQQKSSNTKTLVIIIAAIVIITQIMKKGNGKRR